MYLAEYVCACVSFTKQHVALHTLVPDNSICWAVLAVCVLACTICKSLSKAGLNVNRAAVLPSLAEACTPALTGVNSLL